MSFLSDDDNDNDQASWFSCAITMALGFCRHTQHKKDKLKVFLSHQYGMIWKWWHWAFVDRHTHNTHKEMEKEKANPLHAMALGVMTSGCHGHTQTQHIERRWGIEGDSKKDGDNWSTKQIMAAIITMFFLKSRERWRDCPMSHSTGWWS